MLNMSIHPFMAVSHLVKTSHHILIFKYLQTSELLDGVKCRCSFTFFPNKYEDLLATLLQNVMSVDLQTGLALDSLLRTNKPRQDATFTVFFLGYIVDPKIPCKW